MYLMWMKRHSSRSVRRGWEKDSVPRMWDKKEVIVELESSSMPCTGKSTARWHIDRSSEKCSKRREQAKRYQKNFQNADGSIVEYRGRESIYA